MAGILCKVSPSKEQFVTNISQGGSSLGFDSVLIDHPYLSYSKTYDVISQLILKLAKHLEKYTEHIADIAFDIALNKEGHPYHLLKATSEADMETIDIKGKGTKNGRQSTLTRLVMVDF